MGPGELPSLAPSPVWPPLLAPADCWGTQLSACFRRVLPGADQPAVPEGARERASLHLQCCGGWLPVRVSPGPGSPGDRGCAQGVRAGTGHVGAFVAQGDVGGWFRAAGDPPSLCKVPPCACPVPGAWADGVALRRVGWGSGHSPEALSSVLGSQRGAVHWGVGQWARSRRDSRAPAWRPRSGRRAMLLCSWASSPRAQAPDVTAPSM